jgi:DNA-binding SARP family transcriptional activator
MQDPVVVEIRLFGGVRATGDGGTPVDVGPAKCQTVLAALALSAGSAVPVSRLVEIVWGAQPPRTADKTPQSYVTRLRKGLGADAIARTGAAYRLDLDADDVDVTRFQRLLAAGDVEAALGEWTGTPLAGLDAHGLTATVDALVEQWLGAVELHLARRVETDAPAAIGSLTELTANHPFREGLWALLMTALYRVGRQADALAAYRRARHHLVEALGVEPGPRLRELEASILGHDERLRVDRSSRGAALGLRPAR